MVHKMRFIGYKKDGELMRGAPGNYKQGQIVPLPFKMSKLPYWELVDPVEPRIYVTQIPHIYTTSPSPDKLIHILYVLSTTRVGGAETVLKRLLRSLDKSRIKAHVLVTGDKGSLHDEYASHAQVTYVCDDKPTNLEEYIYSKAVEGHYGFIHFINHWNLYDVIPRIKKACPDTEIIASLFVNMYHFRQAWVKDIERIKRVTPHLYALVTDSSVNQKVFPNITIIHNGVPTDIFTPVAKKPKTVVWVGRSTPSKRPEILVNASQRLKDYNFTVISSERTDLAASLDTPTKPNLVFKYGLSEEQIAKELSTAQYYVFTSYVESMPLTVLEAMSSGCCVLAMTGVSDPDTPQQSMGDLTTVIQDGINGCLMPQSDKDPDVPDVAMWIADNLPKLEKRAKQMGAEARRTILENEYTVDEMVKQYEHLYGAIGSHGGQRRIAFLWGFIPHHGLNYWETKVDSHQEAIRRLSRDNVVQVYVPTTDKPTRKILNGQNMVYYPCNNNDTESDLHKVYGLLHDYTPDMIFFNMFEDPKWPPLIHLFPDAWKALVHYGETDLRIPFIREVDAIIVQQEYLRDMIAKTNKISVDKIHVIPFCMEQWLFKPIKLDKIYTGVMVADFRRNIKRQHLLIEAWRGIPGKLLLVGYYDRSLPKNYHEDLKRQARKLGLQDRIVFVDGYPHESLPELLNKCKVGFLTSSHEGGSRALIEMMACGLPVLVLKDCVGTIHMVKDGVDGVIAEPTPSSITKHTLRMLEHYEEMGAKASAKTRNAYPYHMMTEKYRCLVQSSQPEITVITTSLNRGAYIEETIRSVLNQTARAKVNHLIIDGGSTDETVKVLERYKGKVHVVYDYGSQTSALIKAMQVIEERFPQTTHVGWLNADDYYLPNHLVDLLQALRGMPPDVAMIYGEMMRVGDHGGILHKLTEPYITLEMLGTRGNIIGQPAVLIRMDAFKDIKKRTGHYFNPNYDYTQDYELWYRFLVNGYRIMHLLKNGQYVPTACLRSHAKQMSVTHREEQNEERNKVKDLIAEAISGVKPPWTR